MAGRYVSRPWYRNDIMISLFLLFGSDFTHIAYIHFYEFILKDGDASTSSKKFKALTEKNKKLEAENHLLKFKVEVLLDMVLESRFRLRLANVFSWRLQSSMSLSSNIASIINRNQHKLSDREQSFLFTDWCFVFYVKKSSFCMKARLNWRRIINLKLPSNDRLSRL